MFINKDSIIINGVSMGRYILEAKYSYNKLWSSDSGRNLAGTQSGTLIGIFPKIVLEFRKLTRSELDYDPNKKTNITITTYTGDYEIDNKNIIRNNTKNEGFSCSFISVSKRSWLNEDTYKWL